MENVSMLNKICLITGANSGVGKATAMGLAQMGAHVLMVVRDRQKGETARAEIVAQSGNPNIDVLIADLAEQDSICQLANRIQQDYAQIDVLVNNAAVVLSDYTTTVDGIETTLAVNVLAPFLLTHLLLPQIHKSTYARIINVSARGYARHINLDNLEDPEAYEGIRAYTQSKLMNILFTFQLAKKLVHTHITVNCLHPGIIRTRLDRDIKGSLGLFFNVLSPFMGDAQKGAQTSIYLASDPAVAGITGKFYLARKEHATSPITHDDSIMMRFWDKALTLTKLTDAVYVSTP